MPALVTTLRSLLAQADEHLRLGHLRLARRDFEDLLDKAQDRSDPAMAVIARSELARIHLRRRDLEAAADTLHRASIELDPEHLDSYGRYRAVLARLAHEQGPRDTAHAELLGYLQWAEDAAAHDQVLDASLLLASNAPPEDRVDWLQRGIDHALDYGANQSLGRAYNDLGAAFDLLGQLEEALEAYQQSLNWHREAGSVRDHAGAAWAVGSCACRLKEWPLARQRLEEAVDLAKKDEACGDLVTLATADLAHAYEAAGDVVEARRLVIKALALGREQDLPNLWPQRWEALRIHAVRLELDPDS